MQIKTAHRAFLDEFSKYERESLPAALRAVSNDTGFAEQTEELLGLEARLTLLERLAFSRGIPASLMMMLSELLLRTRKLRDQRDALARGVRPEPSASHLHALATEAVRLQEGLRAFVADLDNTSSEQPAQF